MCRLFCTQSTTQETDLLDVVSDDNPLDDRVGEWCGREVYCQLPTTRSQCCYAALVFSTLALGVTGSLTLPAYPTVGTVFLVCSAINFAGASAQLVLTNMSCRNK